MDNPKNELTDLLRLSPQNLLLKWFHYHLKKVGKDRENIELKDSECYLYLINNLTSSMPEEMFP